MDEESRKRLNSAILEIVDNQLRDEDPPQTKATYARLVKQGYSDQEARNLIGCAVTTEIYDVLKQSKPYNDKRFLKALRRLPSKVDPLIQTTLRPN